MNVLISELFICMLVTCKVSEAIPMKRNITCPPGKFLCKEESICIDDVFVCDFKFHCRDKSDERNCEFEYEFGFEGDAKNLKSDLSLTDEGFILVSNDTIFESAKNVTKEEDQEEEAKKFDGVTLHPVFPIKIGKSLDDSPLFSEESINDFSLFRLENIDKQNHTSSPKLFYPKENITELTLNNDTIAILDLENENIDTLFLFNNTYDEPSVISNASLQKTEYSLYVPYVEVNKISTDSIITIQTSTTTQSTTTPYPCREREFYCRGESICIPVEWVCDQTKDCWDGTDEESCDLVSCPSDMSKCNDTGQCIYNAWICDGAKDCENGSDEMNCY